MSDPNHPSDSNQQGQPPAPLMPGGQMPEMEPPPPSRMTLIKERIMRWIDIIWPRIEPYWMPYIHPVYMRLWRYVVAVSLWLWASPLGIYARRLWHKFMQTKAGIWLNGYVMQHWARGVATFKRWQALYKKLTGPPPDPIMMAMMMHNEQIDIDDEDISMVGTRLFRFIGVFFVIFIGWAIFAKLDESVRADGSIVPPSSVQLVQNRLPGSLITIDTKLGEHVEKGQVLFRLEDEDVIANFDDNEITRFASLAMASRLRAEEQGADIVVFPAWLRKTAPDVVASEQEVFARRQNALQARLTSLERRIKNFEEKIEILKPLVEAGHEARLVLLEMEGQYFAAKDEYEAVVATFRAEASAQLAEVSKMADQADARENAYRAKVAHAEVRAPTAGTITAVHVKTVGAVVQAGTILAELVPDEKSLLIMARLLAEDVADVYPGQIAQVSLAAYDVSRYGTMEGRVQRIAQNTTQEENMPPYYQTMIEIPNPRFAKSDEEPDIVPGSPVMVDIIGKKRSIMSYILTPLDRAAGRAFREK